MDAARKLTLVVAVLLALFAIYGLTIGAPAIRLNRDTAAVQIVAALWGFGAAWSGRRNATLYLVAVGLLLAIDAFMGLTRGTFYLSFDAMRGPVTPLGRPERYLASLPHGALGAVALVAGLIFANRDAKERTDRPPT